MAFLDYFLEVYYGENDNIRQMQKCITELRKDMFDNWSLSRLNTHPSVKRFNRLVEKEFGFKGFCLYISPKRIINAFTMPIYLNVKSLSKRNNLMSNLVVTKNGYKFKPEAEYTAYVCIYRGILMDSRLTDREIMAIILHEIGHNFQAAISNKQSALAQSATILYIISIITNLMNFSSIKQILRAPFVLTGAYQAIMKSIDDILSTNFKHFYHFTDIFRATLNEIKYPFNKALKYVNLISRYSVLPAHLALKLNPFSILIASAMGKYRGEKIADNFATMYGYGPDIASGTSKLEGDEILSNIHIPLASPLIGLIESTFMFLYTLPDEHPAAVSRVKDQSDYLKKELEREDFDPKFKKEVMRQIKEIDAQVDEIINIHYKGAASDYMISYKFYQLMLYKIFDV